MKKQTIFVEVQKNYNGTYTVAEVVSPDNVAIYGNFVEVTTADTAEQAVKMFFEIMGDRYEVEFIGD